MLQFPVHLDYSKIAIQRIAGLWPASREVELSLLRIDRIHPEISGNKWFKLKYNLAAALRKGKDTVLTFGGPWSNHIAATAALCAQAGLKSIGLIRGENPANWSRTLRQAAEKGMQIEFISRKKYAGCARVGRLPEDMHFPHVYVIAEGGCNALGIQGCEEILHLQPTETFSHLCCPVGTGTTLSGLIRSAHPDQQVLGFVPMKPAAAKALTETILHQVADCSAACRWRLIDNYHFGGFARKTDALLEFMKSFRDKTGVSLDFVYTAKMMYGLIDWVNQGYFPQGSRLLALHTGGLQGNASWEHMPEPVHARA